MTTNVVIIENDNLYTWSLENMLEQLGNYHLLATFKEAEQALPYIQANEAAIDILLVDILLDGVMKGHELVAKLKNRTLPVIFMTEWKDEDLYRQLSNLPNHAFLVKSFHRFTLDSTINVLVSKNEVKIETPPPPVATNLAYIRVGTKQEVIDPLEIRWIEANKNYCCIQTEKKQYTIKRSMKLIYTLLPPEKFIFIHQSYIVRIDLIKKIDIKALQVVVGDTPFHSAEPLSKTSANNFNSWGNLSKNLPSFIEGQQR